MDSFEKNLTLEGLLAGLEKVAADESEKKEEKKEEAKGFFAGKKEGEKEEKQKDKKEEDEEEEQEKSAALKTGTSLAQEVLTKLASTNTQKETNSMIKSASEAGKALAQALLKQAGIGDQITANGIPAGVVPLKTQNDLAAQQAERELSVKSQPGTDGKGNGGTVNNIFDAVIQDALASGAKSEFDLMGNSAAEGLPNNIGAPNQVPATHDGNGDQQEKAAAVAALVEGGYDFDSAVEMVKAASFELDQEEETQTKQAALSELLSQGVDFDSAVSMIKSASARVDVEQEKRAALGMMLEAGVDFDSAIDLVQAKAKELYGV